MLFPSSPVRVNASFPPILTANEVSYCSREWSYCLECKVRSRPNPSPGTMSSPQAKMFFSFSRRGRDFLLRIRRTSSYVVGLRKENSRTEPPKLLGQQVWYLHTPFDSSTVARIIIVSWLNRLSVLGVLV